MAQHYNVCGAACATTESELAIQVVAWMYSFHSAISISLNEICLSQWTQLRADLDEGGWDLGTHGAFVISRAHVAGCPGTDKSFGNALITSFDPPYTGGGGWGLSNPGLDCFEPMTECRTMVCSPGVLWGGTVNACSSHFINTNDTIAQQQAAEYAWIAAANTSGRRMLAGDFNLGPGQLPTAYGSYLNVGCASGYCGTKDGEMIDYIFATPGQHQPLDPECILDASDHCFVQGRVLWTIV